MKGVPKYRTYPGEFLQNKFNFTGFIADINWTLRVMLHIRLPGKWEDTIRSVNWKKLIQVPVHGLKQVARLSLCDNDVIFLHSKNLDSLDCTVCNYFRPQCLARWLVSSACAFPGLPGDAASFFAHTSLVTGGRLAC